MSCSARSMHSSASTTTGTPAATCTGRRRPWVSTLGHAADHDVAVGEDAGEAVTLAAHRQREAPRSRIVRAATSSVSVSRMLTGSTVMSSRAVVIRAPPVGSMRRRLPTASTPETLQAARRPVTSSEVTGRRPHVVAAAPAGRGVLLRHRGVVHLRRSSPPGAGRASAPRPPARHSPPMARSRRLETAMATTAISSAATADAVAQRRAGVRADAQLHDRRGDQHRDEVHHLDQRVDRRAGGVLERVADGVADDGRRVRLGALAAVGAVLDDLLRVVPRPAGVGQEHRHEHTGADGAGEVAGQRTDAEAEARRRSAPSRPAGRGWPARAASPWCRCRRHAPYSGFSV